MAKKQVLTIHVELIPASKYELPSRIAVVPPGQSNQDQRRGLIATCARIWGRTTDGEPVEICDTALRE